MILITFPRTEHTADVIYKDEDGSFPVADKLVEIANYYGFDGYFLNAEEAQIAEFMPLSALLTDNSGLSFFLTLLYPHLTFLTLFQPFFTFYPF